MGYQPGNCPFASSGAPLWKVHPETSQQQEIMDDIEVSGLPRLLPSELA